MSVGIRLSDSGTHFLVSSSVDQTTCLSPAAFAAFAILAASTFSFSGEKWLQ
jgi:hypothetical protein